MVNTKCVCDERSGSCGSSDGWNDESRCTVACAAAPIAAAITNKHRRSVLHVVWCCGKQFVTKAMLHKHAGARHRGDDACEQRYLAWCRSCCQVVGGDWAPRTRGDVFALIAAYFDIYAAQHASCASRCVSSGIMVGTADELREWLQCASSSCDGSATRLLVSVNPRVLSGRPTFVGEPHAADVVQTARDFVAAAGGPSSGYIVRLADPGASVIGLVFNTLF